MRALVFFVETAVEDRDGSVILALQPCSFGLCGARLCLGLVLGLIPAW